MIQTTSFLVFLFLLISPITADAVVAPSSTFETVYNDNYNDGDSYRVPCQVELQLRSRQGPHVATSYEIQSSLPGDLKEVVVNGQVVVDDDSWGEQQEQEQEPQLHIVREDFFLKREQEYSLLLRFAGRVKEEEQVEKALQGTYTLACRFGAYDKILRMGPIPMEGERVPFRAEPPRLRRPVSAISSIASRIS